ncbi:uncharacterized protein LOC133476680 isoform X2 [Phyllopteryx taeniolatus]|uniref:uncharacterized protein LOC133476680 isoform X2 n=1 Tax=Phyllopteryx taeniolatus TaxID=161469 RepID=UPI002AD2B805|nr:uncharacterized protein LOC133476680 isoform X2 [Phyllopteryx taeniolatus]
MRTISVAVLILLSSLWLAASTLMCPERQHPSLICFNDYDKNMTCIWNDSDARTADGRAPCSLHTESVYPKRIQYWSECLLRPVDASTPSSLRTCSLAFDRESRFQEHHELRVWINCSDVAMSYKPACHVKLAQPGKPQINQTTISWAGAKQGRESTLNFQLEWKLADEPWNGASVHREEKHCNQLCRSELSVEQLLRGKVYEIRVRVRRSTALSVWSDWSDWSASTRWMSDVGEATAPPADSLWLVLGVTVSGTAFAVFLALLVYRTDKNNWLSAFEKIRGPLLPDPGKSFLQNWASPPFSSESFQSFLCPVDILSVNSVGCVDPEEPWYPGGPGYLGALLEKMMMMKTARVRLVHPRSSQLWPSAPPVASLTSGNLQPCAADSPYGHVGALMDQDREMKDTPNCFLEVLSRVSQRGSEVTPVISDYEKIEMLQSEHAGEESEGKHGGEGKSPFGGSFIEGSVQLSLKHECIIQTLHYDDTPELPSADSGIGSVGEEQGGLEASSDDGEEKGLGFQCRPDPPGRGSPLSCRRPTLESLRALMLDTADFTRGSVVVEPSGGGYMSLCPQGHIAN